MTYEEAAQLHAFLQRVSDDVIENYVESDSRVKKEIFADRLPRAQSLVTQSTCVRGLEVFGRLMRSLEDTMGQYQFVPNDGLPPVDDLLRPSETKPPKIEGKNGKRRKEASRRRGRQPSAATKKGSAA